MNGPRSIPEPFWELFSSAAPRRGAKRDQTKLRMESAKYRLKSAPLPPFPLNRPKIRTGPLRARGVLGFVAAVRSNLAHNLSADYLWMTFCRLSAVGCLLFCFFVVYL